MISFGFLSVSSVVSQFVHIRGENELLVLLSRRLLFTQHSRAMTPSFEQSTFPVEEVVNGGLYKTSE